MTTAAIRVGTVGLALLMATIPAGRATAQGPAIPPPQPPGLAAPEAAPDPGVPAVNPPVVSDCNRQRGPIRARLHRAHCKRCLEAKLLGFREEFNEWPLGAALYANCRAEVANGEAARMTFYHYDFVDGTATLKLQGQDKLDQIRAMLPTSFAPIVVERTPERPALAEARRATLLAELARGDFPLPPQRVLVGKPVPIGRSGGEAALISLNQMGGVLSGSGFRTMMMGGGGPSGFSQSGMSGGSVFGSGGGMSGGGGMMGGGMMGGGMMNGMMVP